MLDRARGAERLWEGEWTEGRVAPLPGRFAEPRDLAHM